MIVAVQSDSVVNDLIKDCSFKYFMTVLTDPDALVAYKAMSAFVLARLLDVSRQAQELALGENLIPILLEVLEEDVRLALDHSQCNVNQPLRSQSSGSGTNFHARIISGVVDARRCRQFVIFCLGKLWRKFDTARWFGVRNNAHERIYPFLDDPSPEVRAAAIYTLGTFMDNSEGERSDHANAVDHSVGSRLIQCAQVFISLNFFRVFFSRFGTVIILFATGGFFINC